MAAQLRDVNVGLGAAICEEADLQGAISFGSQTIAHPKSAVIALAAPIVIGDRTILEDHARLENADLEQQEQNTAEVMTVGGDNIFESGCIIRSAKIGDGNWFEAKSETLVGSVIGNNCIIGSGVVIGRDEIVPDNSIVVCIQDAATSQPTAALARRVTRPQKEYLLKARETLTQRYLDTFLDAKSPYALGKNHRIIPIVQRP